MLVAWLLLKNRFIGNITAAYTFTKGHIVAMYTFVTTKQKTYKAFYIT